jgi:uncharacterized protein with HEPN domain
MSPRDLVYLGHMLDMARKATTKVAGLTRDAYDGDENLRLALTHLVQVIGEAGRHVSDAFREAHPEIPWVEIIGMRHKVVASRNPMIHEASAVRRLGPRTDSSWRPASSRIAAPPAADRQPRSAQPSGVAWYFRSRASMANGTNAKRCAGSTPEN